MSDLPPSESRACVDCLRRSWLLAALGPYIEKVATGSVGRRSPELLRLGNEDLVEVVAPNDGKRLIGAVAAREEDWFAELQGDHLTPTFSVDTLGFMPRARCAMRPSICVLIATSSSR